MESHSKENVFASSFLGKAFTLSLQSCNLSDNMKIKERKIREKSSETKA